MLRQIAHVTMLNLRTVPLRLGTSLVVVVGIGVNLATAPEGLPYPATCLAARGFIVHPERMLAVLSDAWISFERLWNGGRGMPQIRELWLAKAAGRGANISVSVGERVVEGVFETLDDSGRLILRKADGSKIAIAAGEVHFGDAATRAKDFT